MPKYTTKQMIRAILEARGIVSAAARALGCSRATVMNYAKRHPEVADALTESRQVIIDLAESRLVDMIEDPTSPDHFRSVNLVLKTLGRDRGYGDHQEIQHSGRVALSTPEEWKALFTEVLGVEPEGEG